MPTNIKLVLIRASDAPALPNLTLRDNTIADWFGAATSGELRIEMPQGGAKVSQLDSTAMTGPTLHWLLRRHVRPPARGTLAREIGLLFCRNWVRQNSLKGLMFDYDGCDPDFGSFRATAPGDVFGAPREACVVFTDPFSGQGVEELTRTALHELGHVFNLAHDPTNRSLVGEHQILRDRFSPQDRDRLTSAARGDNLKLTKMYMPGGANFMDYRSGAPTQPTEQSGNRAAAAALRLEGTLAKDRYLLGEPVVLDLRLATARKTAVPVAPALDPAYHNTLRIWYETPQGERRLYRPHLHYCRSADTCVDVTDGAPLENNPRVNVGSRGLTFLWPGTYTIWADFALTGGSEPVLVSSDRTGFEVVLPRNDDECEISRTLCDPSIALYVAQKGGPLSRRKKSSLARVAGRHPKRDSVKHLRYVLAVEAMRRHRYADARRWVQGLTLNDASLATRLREIRRTLRDMARSC